VYNLRAGLDDGLAFPEGVTYGDGAGFEDDERGCG
jgi:hypothetical protein